MVVKWFKVSDARDRAADVFADLTDVDLHRHRHPDFLNRAWKLRENVTAYDAVYVALVAPIVTGDAALGRAPGHRTQIEVIA